ncbi:MAG: hypothetical protein IT386_01965 [Deltaproteobacteria bacterium]|nr:hypothetical protein [Deltaproteobacteria bacterium]
MSEAGSATIASGGADAPGLRRGLEALARRMSRVLSARAQTRLEISIGAVEASSVADFAAQLGLLDRCAVIVLAGDTACGFVLLSRPLAFALLALRFGARSMTVGETPPERAYTRIEERAIEKTARDLWEALSVGAPNVVPEVVRVAGVEDAESLRERDDGPLWLTHFVVTGLAQEERIVLAIPHRAARPVRSIEGAASAR